MKTYNTDQQGYLLAIIEAFDEEGNVISTSNQTIPEGHRLHSQALAEVEEGEAEILPYVEPLPTQDEYTAAIQKHLDELAVANGFNSILTAVSYADEPSVKSFQDLGIAMRAWRSLVWESAYTSIASFEESSEPQPSIAEVLAGLPSYV
tara:strand:+ start:929 stop:1375 length:447 start_codon:yes stop_codon:yes gene_type:complete